MYALKAKVIHYSKQCRRSSSKAGNFIAFQNEKNIENLKQSEILKQKTHSQSSINSKTS
jgi:hypothetical protein